MSLETYWFAWWKEFEVYKPSNNEKRRKEQTYV